MSNFPKNYDESHDQVMNLSAPTFISKFEKTFIINSINVHVKQSLHPISKK